ncbi:hypothetical protein RIF29_09810 [Crotalaria pallida]|uniref:Histidine-containing phosphotransfer protein n=1 Tax=Crotalaria pallida TaxID=3830 RepID=A0AAN9FZR6_CROPI
MLCVVPAAFSQIYFTRRALVLISPFLSLFLCPNQNPLFPLPPSLSIFFPNLPFTNHVPSSSSHAAAATSTYTATNNDDGTAASPSLAIPSSLRFSVTAAAQRFSLAAASPSIGAKKVKAECTLFKEYCRTGNAEGCRKSFQQLKKEYAALRKKLEAYFQEKNTLPSTCGIASASGTINSQ